MSPPSPLRGTGRLRLAVYRLLGLLPLPLLHALAMAAGFLLYRFVHYRRPVVEENLAAALPDCNPGQRRELARRFYRRLAEVALETLWASRAPAPELLRRVRLCNPQLLREYSGDLSRPVILLAIHQGNWEWMLHGIALATGMPVDPVYQPLHDPAADTLMYRMRSRFGARPIPVAGAPRQILRQRGEPRLVGLVADQSPGRDERCHWTGFLGRQTPFYTGAEVIARSADLPVLFARCRRLRRGHYEVEFQEITRHPGAASGHEIIERYARLAERAIREEPAGWLWSHRRWKLQKPGNGAGGDGSAGSRPRFGPL